MKAETDHILRDIGVKNVELITKEVRDETIRPIETKKLSQNYTTFYASVKNRSLIKRFAKFYEIDCEMFQYPMSPFRTLKVNK